METELSLNRIMAAYVENREETAEQLNSLLQQRTKQFLELDLLEHAKKSLLPGVELEQETRERILWATADFVKEVSEGLDITRTCVVLGKDGRLFSLEVLEQADLAHSETKRKGTLGEEIVDSDLIIEYAPLFIEGLENLILFAPSHL